MQKTWIAVLVSLVLVEPFNGWYVTINAGPYSRSIRNVFRMFCACKYMKGAINFSNAFKACNFSHRYEKNPVNFIVEQEKNNEFSSRGLCWKHSKVTEEFVIKVKMRIALFKIAHTLLITFHFCAFLITFNIFIIYSASNLSSRIFKKKLLLWVLFLWHFSLFWVTLRVEKVKFAE